MLRPDTFALTALLAALTAIGPLTTDMYLPSLPDIARGLSASTAQVQLTLSVYLVGFAVGQILYGPISDRYGRRPVLFVALAIYCVASLVCAISVSIEMLIVGRTFQAIGGAGGVVLARAVVRDLYSGARAGRELSLIASVMALAPAIAPIVGGLLQIGFGWQASFVALLVGGIAGLAAVFWLLPETLPEGATESISPLSIMRSYAIVARNTAFLGYLAVSTACYAGLFAWISGASFVLQNVYGLSPFNFGVSFAVGALGYMTGSTLSARLSTRIGLNSMIGIGGCFSTVGGLAMIGSVALGLTSGMSLVLPMAVYLAGLGMVLPHSIAGAMTPFPERAGAASALFGFLQQCVAALCGAIVGALLGSSAWPLAIAVGVMGVATLLLWIVTRSARAQATHS